MKSAYGSIVGGIAGAGSKITESIGRGVNTLSFDKNFIRVRTRELYVCTYTANFSHVCFTLFPLIV